MATPGVVVAYPFDESTSGWFTHCLADLIRFDANAGRYICGPAGGLIALSSGPRIGEIRNRIVDEFASKYTEESEWLLMIDSDMTFPATLVEQFMAVASPEETPILGGLCFTGGASHEPQPTVYRQILVEGQLSSVQVVYDYPRDALVKVGATGGACLMIHRKALAAMKEHFGRIDGRDNPYPWFADGIVGPRGEAWGEDVVFCLRANAIGIPVHVLTSVKLGHVKPMVIDEVFYDNHRETRAMDELLGKPNGQQPNRAERRRAAREKAST